MSRGCHDDRPVQLSLRADGLLAGDATTEQCLAVWAERVAAFDAAALVILAEREAQSAVQYARGTKR